MNPEKLHVLYQDFQKYIDWSDADAQRVRAIAPLLEPHLAELIDDFYAAI